MVAPISRSGIATRSTGRRADRLVAVEREGAVLPGEDAHQQPQQRARVADVDRALGRPQAAQPHAVHAQPRRAVVQQLDARAELLDRRDRRQRVGARAEAVDLDRTVGQRAEQHGAMGDRLVAGRRDLADERARRRDAQDVVVVRHADPSPASGVAIAE